MPNLKSSQPPHMGAYVVKMYRLHTHMTEKELAAAIGIGLKAYRDFESEKNVEAATLSAILIWFLKPPPQIYS
jgi:DNA-binding XRE family transcriptional regulator